MAIYNREFISHRGQPLWPVVSKRIRSWCLRVKVESSNLPPVGQLPHVAALCWPRPASSKWCKLLFHYWKTLLVKDKKKFSCNIFREFYTMLLCLASSVLPLLYSFTQVPMPHVLRGDFSNICMHITFHISVIFRCCITSAIYLLEINAGKMRSVTSPAISRTHLESEFFNHSQKADNLDLKNVVLSLITTRVNRLFSPKPFSLMWHVTAWMTRQEKQFHQTTTMPLAAPGQWKFDWLNCVDFRVNGFASPGFR